MHLMNFTKHIAVTALAAMTGLLMACGGSEPEQIRIVADATPQAVSAGLGNLDSAASAASSPTSAGPLSKFYLKDLERLGVKVFKTSCVQAKDAITTGISTQWRVIYVINATDVDKLAGSLWYQRYDPVNSVGAEFDCESKSL